MARIEKTVFISYRRKDIAWATLVYKYLSEQNYDVFFDFLSISSGDFEQIIISNIRARAHFILILTPTALERCNQPDDWLRREIETALEEKRNIVPIFLEGFDFGNPSIAEYLTGKLANLKKYNGQNVPPGFFDEAMDRLEKRFLNIELEAVLHPVNPEIKQVVVEQKLAVNAELKEIAPEEENRAEYGKRVKEARRHLLADQKAQKEKEEREKVERQERVRKDEVARRHAEQEKNERLERSSREIGTGEKAQHYRKAKQRQTVVQIVSALFVGGVLVVGIMGGYDFLRNLLDSPGNATQNDRLQTIQDRGYVLVSTDPNYPPQSSLNMQGRRPSDTKCPVDALTATEMQGFDVDVAKAIGESLGVETCFMTPSWDLVVAGGWSDKWDLSVGSMSITVTRQQVLDFSVPYYYAPAVVAVHADSGVTSLDELDGQTLCVAAGTEYEAWLNHDLQSMNLPQSFINSEAPNVTVVPLVIDQECAAAIQAGSQEFVGYVSSEEVIDTHIAEGIPVVKLLPPVFADQIAIAFDKASSLSNERFIAEINRIVSGMHNNGRLSELSTTWYGMDVTRLSQ